MINIMVVSHGNLGSALIRAAELITGPAEGLFAVALQPNDSPSHRGRFFRRSNHRRSTEQHS